MSIFGDLLSPSKQPLGSTINNAYGTFTNVTAAIGGSNPGTGPGCYFDKAGKPYSTQAEAAQADYDATVRGFY